MSVFAEANIGLYLKVRKKSNAKNFAKSKKTSGGRQAVYSPVSVIMSMFLYHFRPFVRIKNRDVNQ